jgi:type II secretory pathway component PulK
LAAGRVLTGEGPTFISAVVEHGYSQATAERVCAARVRCGWLSRLEAIVVNPFAALEAAVRFALTCVPARLRRRHRRLQVSSTVDARLEVWLERVFAEIKSRPLVQTERDFMGGVRQRIERHQAHGRTDQSGREPNLPE